VRITDHPILGPVPATKAVTILVDGQPVSAVEGEPIAAALMAAGKWVFRYTRKREEPRGYFCGLGRCTDCVMTVDGAPYVRTCVTPVAEGMRIETQKGFGQWSEDRC
jgi:aerobic-type carbon monoxide dehydrogenase small subunit (CoxS/CutS family)